MHILVERPLLTLVPLGEPFPPLTLCGAEKGDFDIPWARATHPVWSGHVVCIDCRWLRNNPN
jgi:hypothetical protein